MSEQELKPCPFCGVDTRINMHDSECYFNVADEDDEAMTNSEMDSHYNRIIKAWNTRTDTKGQDDE